MIPGTLWHVVRVDTEERTVRGHVYIDAPRWFLARDYASRFFCVNREAVELAVLPDGEQPLLPCRVVSAVTSGALIVSRRRAAKAVGGNGHG